MALESSDDESKSKMQKSIADVVESVTSGKATAFREIKKNVESQRDKLAWSDEERQRLLDGVKVFGVHEIERLKEVVGTRSAFEVLQYLHNMKSFFENVVPPVAVQAQRDHHKSKAVVDRKRKQPATPAEKRGPSKKNKKLVVDEGNDNRKEPTTEITDGNIIENQPIAEDDSGSNSGTKPKPMSRSPVKFSYANMHGALQRFAIDSPDSKLMEWQQVVSFILGNRRDFSADVTRLVLTQLMNAPVDTPGHQYERGSAVKLPDFSNIYRYLLETLENKRRSVTLSRTESRIIKFLIHDVGECARNISRMEEKQKHFRDILYAYRRDSLRTENASTSSSLPSFSEDVLCSLNPLCVPSKLMSNDVASTSGTEHDSGSHRASIAEIDFSQQERNRPIT